MNKIKLTSEIDSSVNYVISHSDGGYFESRFVQRSSDYFIIYLSSHTGCNQACRMCHLTQSKQTMMSPATMEDYITQAKNIIDNVDFNSLKTKGLKRIKYSFMARGEPLLNPTLVKDWEELRRNLRNLVPGYFDIEFNISTIYPEEFKSNLNSIFKTSDTILYYSIYSVDDKFRKKWLGKSHIVHRALKDLRYLRMTTEAKVKFHSAFIKDQNDTEKDIEGLKTFIKYKYLSSIDDSFGSLSSFDFNIVKYNPFSEKFGTETPITNLAIIRKQLNAKVKNRVGLDVKASCGMFYTP